MDPIFTTDLLTLAADTAAAAPPEVLFFSLAGLSALATLALLEIVLGVDNVVFIAILTEKLPEHQQKKARNLGLILAGVMRIGLLAVAGWIMSLSEPFATVLGVELSGRTLILLLGGLFLIAKATIEIHHMLEGHHADPDAPKKPKATFAAVLAQILVIDLVFSIDSVVTAVGMTSNYAIMATAVVAAVAVMIFFAGPISGFVKTHPTMKTLALAFLVLIGVLLVAEGLGEHFNRGYVYFAMAFALAVEIVNMKAGHRKRAAAAAGSESA